MEEVIAHKFHSFWSTKQIYAVRTSNGAELRQTMGESSVQNTKPIIEYYGAMDTMMLVSLCVNWKVYRTKQFFQGCQQTMFKNPND